MRLRIARVPIASLPPGLPDEVWAFAARFTEGAREVFEASVRQKQHLYLVRAGDRLVGIGTVDVYPVDRDGRRRWVIYAGNTMFDEAARGASLTQRLGLECFLRIRLRHPRAPVWFFYDTYSYKSYLMLPRNFVEFWPRRDRPMPEGVRRFLDALARARYGDDWDPARGVCRRGGKRLRPGVATPTAEDLRDPDIAFYVRANPGYTDGDMLAVLVPLHARNWAAVLRRALTRRWRRRRRPAPGG